MSSDNKNNIIFLKYIANYFLYHFEYVMINYELSLIIVSPMCAESYKIGKISIR